MGSLDEVYAFCRNWQERRHDLAYEIDGVVVKVDDLATASRAGLHDQGAPVGHRLQVPARGAHHPAARHQGLDRPHRQGHAVRGARAGVRRRLDGGAGHAAQRGPGAGQGRPPRRHRHRAQGGRRHPRGGRPGAGRAARGSGRVEVPHAVPGLRQAARAPRGRGRPPLHQRRVPGPRWPRHRPLRLPRGHGHRGLRRAAGAPVPVAGHAGRRRRHLLARLRSPARARGLRRHVGRQPAGGHRGLQAATAGQPARRAQHPPRRWCRQRGAGPARSATSTRIDGGHRRRPGRGRGRRAGHRPERARLVRRRGQPGGGRASCARPGSTSRARAPEAPQMLAGKAVVVTGTLERLHPRRGRGGHQGAGRQVARQRVARRPWRWWSATRPARPR